MKVLITGGAGFLGQLLATRLLDRGFLINKIGVAEPLSELILFDLIPANDFGDPRVRVTTGNISDLSTIQQLLSKEVTSIFHLAAIVSGQAEEDFDLGMSINLDASRHLLDVCRSLGHVPKVVFTSSVAVYGGVLPELVLDSTALNPKSSYGAQKAMAELLLNDYSRKGYVDGRVLRLPTITVRPGKPNQAASSFVSGIIREPLNGMASICPVQSSLRIWVSSPDRAVESFIHGHDLPIEEIANNRTINLPGVSVTVNEMMSALEEVSGKEVVDLITVKPIEIIERIVKSWPGAWDDTRAKKLGFKGDAHFVEIVQNYISAHLHSFTK